MADFEMGLLTRDYQPGLHSRSSSLAVSYFTQSQNVHTHYHDPASSIALLSPDATDLGEKVRDHMLATDVASAKDLKPDPTTTCIDNTSPMFQYKDARSWWSDWWLPEILALIFSNMCLASIILVLRTVDDIPLADWHSFVQGSVPYGHIMSIAPNSVISFLSTIAKSCLKSTATACISQVKWLHMQNKRRSLASLQIFADASRGPLGAIGLFFTAETVSSVATVGALITLAALVIDPFTQLVVTYPLKQVRTQDGIAVIYTSSIYDSGAIIQLSGLYATETDLNVPMLGAIYNGIYNLNLNDTHTLALQAIVNGMGGYRRWHDPIADNDRQYPAFGSCDLTTPSGLTVSTLSYFDQNTMNYTSTMIDSSIGPLDGNDGMKLLNIATVMARNNNINPARVSLIPSSNGSSYTVSECSLQWCLQYDTEVHVVNGSIANHDTWLITHRDATNSLPHLELGANPVWNATFAHDPLPNIFNSSEPVPNLNILINHADTLRIRDYLASVLDTSWIASNLDLFAQSPPILAQTLYASQNVSLMMDQFAASMTKQIRASRNATSVSGHAFTNATYVKVHWGWLSLSIATTGMSIIFLLIVIILSHSSATFLWKSNSLALLFHGLDGWSPMELDASRVATMTRMARTMDAQLKRNSDGLLKIVRS